MKSKLVKELDLTPKTAYLAGVIIGDGYLPDATKSKTDLSRDYRISIDISDREFLKHLLKIIKTVITTKSKLGIPKQRGNRLPRLYLNIRNKDLFYFFHKNMQIPLGKKSSIVTVPTKIFESSKRIKKYFLAGYFDADGGFRGKTLGFTTASEHLCQGVSQILDEFKIGYSSELWINKKYNKKFYGIRLRENQLDKFLSTFPLQNIEKLMRIFDRFQCGGAGVVKRDGVCQGFLQTS
tara:strand:+ start:70831 stop:71541 length:711 start_codon:yes stop_codon:yes gene_type:complete